MPLRVTCPGCKTAFVCPDDYVGQSYILAASTAAFATNGLATTDSVNGFNVVPNVAVALTFPTNNMAQNGECLRGGVQDGGQARTLCGAKSAPQYGGKPLLGQGLHHGGGQGSRPQLSAPGAAA